MTPEQRQYIAELEEYLRPIEADGKACYRQDVDRRALLTIIAELEQQNARLTQIISEEPRTKTALPDEFQRLWQACLTLAEKAEFKACFRYLEKLEKQLAERDGLIREYMTESLPYSRRAIEIQQQLEREGGK